MKEGTLARMTAALNFATALVEARKREHEAHENNSEEMKEILKIAAGKLTVTFREVLKTVPEEHLIAIWDLTEQVKEGTINTNDAVDYFELATTGSIR
jgi:hypothetical protein